MGLSEEHRRKIAETIKKRHAEGKQPVPPQCGTCGTFLGKGHDCAQTREKMRDAKFANPTRYWLGKKRPALAKRLSEFYTGRPKPERQGTNHPLWKGGSSLWWHKEARRIMAEHLGRPLTCQDIVHHKDGNYRNNDLKNLQLTNRSEHAKIHNDQGDLR